MSVKESPKTSSPGPSKSINDMNSVPNQSLMMKIIFKLFELYKHTRSVLLCTCMLAILCAGCTTTDDIIVMHPKNWTTG